MPADIAFVTERLVVQQWRDQDSAEVRFGTHRSTPVGRRLGTKDLGLTHATDGSATERFRIGRAG